MLNWLSCSLTWLLNAILLLFSPHKAHTSTAREAQYRASPSEPRHYEYLRHAKVRSSESYALVLRELDKSMFNVWFQIGLSLSQQNSYYSQIHQCQQKSSRKLQKHCVFQALMACRTQSHSHLSAKRSIHMLVGRYIVTHTLTVQVLLASVLFWLC